MCGIVGILEVNPVNLRIYDALTVLQHRGQDAAGIATTAGTRIYLRKDNGLVKDVFRTRHSMSCTATWELDTYATQRQEPLARMKPNRFTSTRPMGSRSATMAT